LRPLRETRTVSYVIGLVSWFLILLPPALAFLYVRAFGVSVVFSDAWSMVPLFGKWSSSTLQLSDLFRQHNEHRMFFPAGIELLLGNVTNYDNVDEMYLIQVCLLVTLVILFLAFRDSIRSSLWLFLFVPVSFLVFSFRQYENMLFGYQINFAFAQMFGVLTLFLLHVLGRRGFEKLTFVAALGSATIASFSVVQGLLVWLAGLLQLFVGTLERPKKKVFVALWGLVGLSEWVAYFVHYTPPKNGPPLLYTLEHPLAGTEYLLRLLGSSLFWDQNLTLVGGSLLACLALVSLLLIYRDRKLGENRFWVSLLFWSFLILGTIMVGRSGSGSGNALVSRYTAFSILAVISVYVMLLKMTLERRSSIRRPNINAVLFVVLAGFVLFGVAISYPNGIDIGTREQVSREKAAFVLSTYGSEPDEALAGSLNPRARVVRDRAPILQRLGYNVFSEDSEAQRSLPPPLSNLSPVSSTTSSALTITANGISQQDQAVIVPQRASFLELTGWAVDADNESAAGGIDVDIDDRLFPAFYGEERQDVASSSGVPSYKYSGFERAIPVSEVGPGVHELSVVVLTSDRRGYYQPSQKIDLEVK
jgi:hypothetical protein